MANSNIAIDSWPTLQISVGVIALFEKIYDGEPIFTVISNIREDAIPLFQSRVWCEKFIAARHIAVIWKQLLISNYRNMVRWVGSFRPLRGWACTDLFDNFSENFRETYRMILTSSLLFSHWSLPLNSVSDSDPNWIRIQSDYRIRIRIRNPDPDPGGQKWPTKTVLRIHGIFVWICGSMLLISVADPDPGSGAFLTPGSGIRNRFFRIPDPKSIFLRA